MPNRRLRAQIRLGALLLSASTLPTLAFVQPAQAQPAAQWTACPGAAQSQRYTPPQLIPGVTWDSWRTLLHQDWIGADRTRPGWSNIDAMREAAAANPIDTDFTGDKPSRQGGYVPTTQATPEQAQAYQNAAALLAGQNPDTAIAALDAIAHDASNPYAAAAAYSAARAALDEGHFTDGIARIGALIANPALQDMHQAAHHLVGTVAYNTGAAPLIAARLTDITHLIMAPAELRCRNTDLRTLMEEADSDLGYTLNETFPTDHFHDVPTWTKHTRAIFGRLAQSNPVLDLIQALSAPGTFDARGIWIEPFYAGSVPYPGYPLSEQDTIAGNDDDQAAVLQHARTMAQQTGNPLWAYALALRTTTLADLPLLQAGEKAVAAAPIHEDERDTLAGWLMAHEARLLLMSGRLDDALSIAKQIPQGLFRFTSPHLFIADGGTRYLLARRDLNGARRWYSQTNKPAQPWETRPFDVALAPDWTTALKGADHRGQDDTTLASGLNLLPAQRLIELSHTPNISARLRRAMLSAGWVRLYMLGDDAGFRALFPQIRAALPETASDIDDIERAWFPWTRRHRITRMLLRLPGLSPNVLWARPPLANEFHGDPPDVFTIAGDNPSDANWWCPADPARMERDFFGLALANPLSSSLAAEPETVQSVFPSGSPASNAPSIDTIAHDWVTWHPLFREADPAQLQRLASVPSGPVRLTTEAIDWAKHSNWFTRHLGWDEGLPETLALAVRSTRYGCRRTGPMGDISRAAWQDLHRLYPASDAAGRTKYWFDEGEKRL